MEQDLHSQKITILSRLVKESSLTLEECLLLLKQEEVAQPVDLQPFTPGTTTPWTTFPKVPNYGTHIRGGNGTFPSTIMYSNPITTTTSDTLNLTGSLTTSTINTKLEDANL